MATWREIKLFCKRNKAILFCSYVAIIYVFLNVFIAENNVSWLRFNKSSFAEYIDDDDVINDVEVADDVGKPKEKVKNLKDNKRNNIHDIHNIVAMKDRVRKREGDDIFDDIEDVNRNRVESDNDNKIGDSRRGGDNDGHNFNFDRNLDMKNWRKGELGFFRNKKRTIMKKHKHKFKSVGERIVEELDGVEKKHEKQDNLERLDNEDDDNDKEMRGHNADGGDKKIITVTDRKKNSDSNIKNEEQGSKDHLEKTTEKKKPKKVKTALQIVMEELERDKLTDTRVVDLSKVNKTVSDVHMPEYKEWGIPGDPGENSSRYVYPDDNLSKMQMEKKEIDYKKNYFDLWVTNKIALHRTLKEARTPECLKNTYNINPLPSTSVIIVFHNEAFTTLLRSVHSILDRTPKSALLEIILLDDFSTDAHLKEPLEIYLKPYKMIKLIRGNKRLGLIKARNLGFLYSKGEIIVFLDSHIECFNGWLEPLVAPIVKDPKAVTFPIINVIDKDTFGITVLPDNNVGSFEFTRMSFKWKRGAKHNQFYYRSPTMPGGLYAISRNWFHHLGAYDPGLELWGGENLEISFKIWMCGGTLLASACSNVGHVFRSMSPHRGSALNKAIKTNAWRVAEVWLDHYKHLYYEKFNYKLADYGDVTNQKALKKSLNCKPFGWYVEEIIPDLKEFIGEGKYSGLVRNLGTGLCLTSDPRHVIIKKCDMMHYRQVWQLSPSGYMSNFDQDMLVVEFITRHTATNTTDTLHAVKMMSKHRTNRKDKALFKMDSLNRLYHIDSHKCLDTAGSGSRNVELVRCSHLPTQKWSMMTREDFQAYHKKRKVPIDWSE